MGLRWAKMPKGLVRYHQTGDFVTFRSLLMKVAGSEVVPQRLKPNCNGSVYGTAEAVPLSKTSAWDGCAERSCRCENPCLRGETWGTHG